MNRIYPIWLVHVLVDRIRKIKRFITSLIFKNKEAIIYKQWGCNKKALLVYVRPVVKLNYKKQCCYTHTNALESGKIVLQLLGLKYNVWFLDCNRTDFYRLVKTRTIKFDLIIGLGTLFDSICLEQEKACKIVYITENNPIISYNNEMQRLKRYEEKYGEKRQLERTNKYYKEEMLKFYSKFIILSDIESFSNLKGEIYSLSPTGFLNPGFSRDSLRNPQTDLLWMGTNSLIHKGLDVLLEAADMVPEVTLHIAGVDVEYIESFKLVVPRNVVVHGFVDIKSEKFLNIVESCSYIILPSCSEAMSTSVLTGMRHGLIPIVIKKTGMDNIPERLRITINSFYPTDIANVLRETKKSNKDELVIIKEALYDYANEEYTIDKYSKRLKEILECIL